MKTPSISFDQCRRKFRRELFIQRQADKDQSEARLFNDAKKLDAQLMTAGYKLEYKTEWSRLFNEKRHVQRSSSSSASPLDGWQTNLNLTGMLG